MNRTIVSVWRVMVVGALKHTVRSDVQKGARRGCHEAVLQPVNHWRVKRLFASPALFLLAVMHAGAQTAVPRDARDSSDRPTKPAWVSRHDVARASGAAVALGFISLVDESVARGMQRRSVQDNHPLNNFADVVQVVGDPGVLLLSTSLFVVGKLSHQQGLASASLRSTEAIIVSGAVTQVLKLSIGRARPVATQGKNAYVFHPFHRSKTNFNSFPSGHTTAAFAAATVFSTEIRHAHPRASRFTTPLLYGVATAVGGARMYNDRHWLSDVVGGALIGHFVGRKITSRVVRQHERP